jgi:hypothetical protein
VTQTTNVQEANMAIKMIAKGDMNIPLLVNTRQLKEFEQLKVYKAPAVDAKGEKRATDADPVPAAAKRGRGRGR